MILKMHSTPGKIFGPAIIFMKIDICVVFMIANGSRNELNNEATPDQTELVIAWHLCKLFTSLVSVVIYLFNSTIFVLPSSFQYKMYFSRRLNCWSLRCSWSIDYRCCSNYILILHLTLGFNILHKENLPKATVRWLIFEQKALSCRGE